MPDDIPVFGPSARHEGLYHQFGFSLHGFQLGPGAGAVMAELIVNGGTQTRDRRSRHRPFPSFHALSNKRTS